MGARLHQVLPVDRGGVPLGTSNNHLIWECVTNIYFDSFYATLCCTEEKLKATANVVYTVLSRKSAHGRCILLSHQTGGWALFRVFPHSTLKERPPLITYTSSAIAAIEQQARRESKPSQHIYITGVTSNITAHHVVFAAAKRWLRSSVEAAGPSLAQASQATHMDTIDTDTQTNRDLLQGGSYLRYAGTSHY